MSENNGMMGLDGIIALVVVASLFNGNGGGLFGGNRGNTAAETAMLMQQDSMRAQVAANASTVNQILGQTGGIIEAVNTVGNRTQDGFSRTDKSLCELAYSLNTKIGEVMVQNKECCCATERAIDRLGDRVLGELAAERQRQADLRIAQLEAEKSNYKQTDELKAYIDSKCGCCKPACGSNADVFGALLLKQLEAQNTTLAAIAAKLASTTTTTTA